MTTRAAYDAAFALERQQKYPQIDALEMATGHAIETKQLEKAARILACPVKKNPPNWQHGRVIYATLRGLLADGVQDGILLDIGTAKGFSAVIMAWAAADAGMRYPVWSVDMVDPLERKSRNSVMETDGALFTIPEFVRPFIDHDQHSIRFFGGGSLALLQTLNVTSPRVRFAFVDGKHKASVVQEEARALHDLQRYGDLLLFDDVHLPEIAAVVMSLRHYAVSFINVTPNRAYALAVRR